MCLGVDQFYGEGVHLGHVRRVATFGSINSAEDTFMANLTTENPVVEGQGTSFNSE